MTVITATGERAHLDYLPIKVLMRVITEAISATSSIRIRFDFMT